MQGLPDIFLFVVCRPEVCYHGEWYAGWWGHPAPLVHLQGGLAIQPSGRDEHCSHRFTVNFLLTFIVQYTITVTYLTLVALVITTAGEISPS